jgi:hypothetical protein
VPEIETKINNDPGIRFCTTLHEIPVLKGIQFAQVTAGARSSFARTPSGKVLAWGANEHGFVDTFSVHYSILDDERQTTGIGCQGPVGARHGPDRGRALAKKKPAGKHAVFGCLRRWAKDLVILNV